ncbi:hypothetical protein GXW74_27145 [Roseomonas eburnea]|uniref:HNH domain-containing protein n=1 Tax=Neoroseomonas eburnea TaxID=1346889 RepID=A0A9X9XKD5_9PROT|nr:hypothetical protein [Neoroseomonas eburnea]
MVAAKADWLVADHWIGFTPSDDTLNARARCQSTIHSQAGVGYVVEYITQTFGEPNPGFETDPKYLDERAAHSLVAGRLVAVHRLRPTARSLREIIGEEDFADLQDKWAKSGERYRWSVAFPIIESYSVVSRPYATEIFSTTAMRRVFGHPSATLRPLNDEERAAIADLVLEPRSTSNAWLGIEDEVAMAEMGGIDPRIRTLIEKDLAASAMEGLTAEQRVKAKLRAAWLANKFAKQRRDAGTLVCDHCGYDAVARASGTGVRPRSLLDVHHKKPLDEGVRYTTVLDFELLCPTCHRFAHEIMRVARLATG